MWQRFGVPTWQKLGRPVWERFGWPVLAGCGVLIAAIVAVLCIALLRPSPDSSLAARVSNGSAAVAQPPSSPKPAVSPQTDAMPVSLVARWVADDYESGNNWYDRARHLSAVQNNSPVAIPNAFNGHPGVMLNGINQFFVVNADDDPVPYARMMTLVAVFKPNRAQAVGPHFWQGGGLIGGDLPDTRDDFGLAWGGNSGIAVVGGGGNFPRPMNGQKGSDGEVTSPDLDLNRTHIAILTFDCPDTPDQVATFTLYVDGAQVDQSSKPSAPRERDIPIALGAGSSMASMFFSGMLAEIRIYNDTNLDVAAITDSLMRTYMSPADRIGINPLDPNHLLNGYKTRQ